MTAADSLNGKCEFCKIVSGVERAEIILETSTALAFSPLKPAASGHTLIIPKVHVTDIWKIGEGDLQHVMTAALAVVHAIKIALRPDGLNLINSAGAVATQTVFHFHLHVVPRWHDDNMGNIWPETIHNNESERHRVAAQIRACLTTPIE